MKKSSKNGSGEILGLLGLFLVIALVLVFGFGSWGTIDAGHRGVVLSMGRVTGEIKGEGFYTKTPWIETVKEMNCQIQKEQVQTDCASKDLQTIRAVVALNLSLMPTNCAIVYQTVGVSYLDTLVAPAMQEGIKAVTARYTAEELVSKRELVREDISKLLGEKLTPIGIRIEALNIVNLDFSQSFNQAIEAKVTAAQNALAAQNMLSQKEFEAKQLVATAMGKAESMAIESKALAQNPQILQLRALEKWNGELPRVMGSQAVPFVDVTASATK
jgi:prohibitin 2